jgi:hypothetical protein
MAKSGKGFTKKIAKAVGAVSPSKRKAQKGSKGEGKYKKTMRGR